MNKYIFSLPRRRLIGVVSLLSLLMVAPAEAATIIYHVEIPKTQDWFTASSYDTINQLLANSVWNGFVLSNSGYPVAIHPQGSVGNKYVFEIVVSSVPSGLTVFADVRNNYTGNLAQTGRQYVASSSGTYDLGYVSP